MLIKTRSEYDDAVVELTDLASYNPDPDTEDAARLSVLMHAIMRYERAHPGDIEYPTIPELPPV